MSLKRVGISQYDIAILKQKAKIEDLDFNALLLNELEKRKLREIKRNRNKIISKINFIVEKYNVRYQDVWSTILRECKYNIGVDLKKCKTYMDHIEKEEIFEEVNNILNNMANKKIHIAKGEQAC